MAVHKAYSATEVVEAFKSGNNKVLAAIYKAHFNSVQHYILQNNGTADDASDIYQEAILVLWRNVQSGKFNENSDANIGGFLYQVARYKWLDVLKSKGYKSTVRLTDSDSQAPHAPLYDEGEQTRPEVEALHKHFKRLGETCRSILQQFYYEKKSLQEIGDTLNYDAATMRTKKYRCMMQLRKMHLGQ